MNEYIMSKELKLKVVFLANETNRESKRGKREKRKYIDALSLVEQQKEFSFIVRCSIY